MMRTCLLFWLACAAPVLADEFRKGTDGYYYDAQHVPHTREAYTAQCERWVTKTYRSGCCETYTKRVLEYYPCTKYNYTPVVKIDPAQPIEKLAAQLAAMKEKELTAELEIRDRYAYVKDAKALLSAYGFDQYRLQTYGAHLNYGEVPTQYPAASGKTQYGVFQQQSAFYGQTPLSLQPSVVTVDGLLVRENELEKVQESNYQARQIARQQLNQELAGVSSQNAAIVAQMQSMERTSRTLLEGMERLIQASKPAAQGTIEETHIYPVEPAPAAEPVGSIDFSAELAKCAACHADHGQVATKIFPKGVTFELAALTPDQRARLATVVAIGKMPKKMPDGSGGPFSEEQRRAWVSSIYAWQR